MAVVFLVDASSSMSRCDVTGSSKPRIDVVMDVVAQFVQQQRSHGATLDRYTLVTFGEDYVPERKGGPSYSYNVIFAKERAESAIDKLASTEIVGQRASLYDTAFRAIDELLV